MVRVIAAPIAMAADLYMRGLESPLLIFLYPGVAARMNDPNATAYVPTGIKPATVFVAGVDDRHVVGNSARQQPPDPRRQ
jgi:hypothetical protein